MAFIECYAIKPERERQSKTIKHMLIFNDIVDYEGVVSDDIEYKVKFKSCA